ncbi:helix-hairpin-helix domain-containing protein [Flavobacterium sp. CYK-4]|uniref:helix-hairpin-helix domain-containing protein n=1 Tax=Flavobacterium lotistagni TaxID=2709660 RepID=UPI001409D99E|nr:helix-hairpin-helix domain-containing protein [Flavobacterium lotistagni]NHM05611.1 helix-hairpin-helix domain-containing protein [Flavobacterium lotistagni]
MKTNPIYSYFKFSKSQRTGIFALFSVIVVFQLVYFSVDFRTKPKPVASKQQWVALPTDTASSYVRHSYVMRPFNPNFITDFKGYKLGMSVEEIDRLFAYRKTNRYVNSAEEFQQVTKVSDSLLKVISPYFKFPDWVNKRNTNKISASNSFQMKEIKVIKDINLATAEDLKKVYGIGDGLSARILKEKEKLGGFVSMQQLQDIWGLSPEVIEKLNQDFKVSALPEVKKYSINQLGIKELMTFPYFKYPIAKSIVTFRSMNNGIKSIEDLSKIPNFPVDRIEIIALYLEF